MLLHIPPFPPLIVPSLFCSFLLLSFRFHSSGQKEMHFLRVYINIIRRYILVILRKLTHFICFIFVSISMPSFRFHSIHMFSKMLDTLNFYPYNVYIFPSSIFKTSKFCFLLVWNLIFQFHWHSAKQFKYNCTYTANDWNLLLCLILFFFSMPLHVLLDDQLYLVQSGNVVQKYLCSRECGWKSEYSLAATVWHKYNGRRSNGTLK